MSRAYAEQKKRDEEKQRANSTSSASSNAQNRPQKQDTTKYGVTNASGQSGSSGRGTNYRNQTSAQNNRRRITNDKSAANAFAKREEERKRTGEMSEGQRTTDIAKTAAGRDVSGEIGFFNKLGTAVSQGGHGKLEGEIYASREQLEKDAKKNEERAQKYFAIRDQYAEKNNKLKENDTFLQGVWHGAVDSAVGMGIDALAPLPPLANMYARVMGNTLGSAQKEGATEEEDFLNANINASIEMATELIGVGGIQKMYQPFSRSARRSLGDVFARTARNRFASSRAVDVIEGAARMAGMGAEESFEELAAGILEPPAEEMIYKKKVAGRNAVSSLREQSRKIASMPQNEMEAQALAAQLNSEEYINDVKKSYAENGLSDPVAESVARKSSEYMTAVMANDQEAIQRIESEIDNLVSEDHKTDWNWEDTLSAMISAFGLSAVSGGATVARASVNGANVKNEFGTAGLKDLAKRAVGFQKEGASETAQTVLDNIEKGNEVTNLQALELADALAEEERQNEKMRSASFQVADARMQARDLVNPFAIMDDGKLSMDDVTRERYTNVREQALTGFEVLEDSLNTDELSEETIDNGVTAIGHFEIGLLNSSDVEEIINSPEVKTVFSQVTGFDFDQHTVKNQDGTVNLAKTNKSIKEALFAQSADNLVTVAEAETANWIDKASGAALENVTKRMDGYGSEAVQQAMKNIDVRDRSAYLYNLTAADTMYNNGRRMPLTWDEARDFSVAAFRDADESMLRDMYEAGIRDREAQESDVVGIQTTINEAIGKRNDNGIAFVTGRFLDERKDKTQAIKQSDMNILTDIARQLHIDIAISDDIQGNGSYVPSTGKLTLNAASTREQNLGYIFMHETTHHLRLYAPEQWNKLVNLVKRTWSARNADQMNKEIDAKIELYKEKGNQILSRDQALEEIIADSAHEFLLDENFAKDVCAEDMGLAKAVLNSIRSTLEKLRAVIANNYTQETGMRSLFSELDILEEAERIWLNAYKEAYKNSAAVGLVEWNERNGQKLSASVRNSFGEGQNIGYHAGDLGKSTGDDYFGQGYYRGSGHFGFGTYFVGDQNKINGYNERNGKVAPVEQVDFSKYHLFKPINADTAYKLHDALRILDGYAKRYSEFADLDRETRRAHDSEKISDLISDYIWSQDASAKESIDRLIESMPESYKTRLEQRVDEAFDRAQSASIEREDVEKDLRDTYKRYYEGTSLFSNEDEYVNERLEQEIRYKEEDKARSKEEWKYLVGEDVLKDYANSWNDTREKISNLVFDLYIALDLRHSKDEIESAIRKTEKTINKYPYGVRGLDSAATVFMKELGYEGVDTRHIESMDNSAYGSVIYDLKGKDLDRKNEIGTARYSISPEEDAAYMDAVNAGDMETAQRMVDDAAKASGLNSPKVYHGTPESFTVFKPNEYLSEANGDNRIKGYFSEDEEYAERYGDTGAYYVGIDNPLTFTEDDWEKPLSKWEKWFEDKGISNVKFDSSIERDTLAGAEIDGVKHYSVFEIFDSNYGFSGDGNLTERIEEAGYDGMRWDFGEKAWIPFDEKKIKSADPVTYDDNGNVIPLSERFNTENEDIRWSIYEEDNHDYAENQIIGESENTPAKLSDEPEVRYSFGESGTFFSRGAHAYSIKPTESAVKTQNRKTVNPLMESGKDILARTMRKNMKTELAKQGVRGKKASDIIENRIDVVTKFFDAMNKYMINAGYQYTFIGLDKVQDAKINVRKTADGTVTITMSAMVKNSDYPVNFDFTTICKKRQAFNAVIEGLTKNAKNGEDISLSPSQLMEINNELRKAGVETACLGCFVESRRYNMQNYTNKVVNLWNSCVDDIARSKGIDPSTLDDFNFANGADATEEDFQNAADTFFTYENTQGEKKNPEARFRHIINSSGGTYMKHLHAADLVTTQGIKHIRDMSTRSKDFLGMLKSAYGQGAPKETIEFVPYNSEIALLPNKKGKISMEDYLKKVGGVRMQSFSDFLIANTFDYMQMVADMAARGFPAHAYTKEIAFAKIFGMTGIKINMSVMFDVQPAEYWGKAFHEADYEKMKDLAKKYAGMTFYKNLDDIPEEFVDYDKDGNRIVKPGGSVRAVTENGVSGYITYLVGDENRSNREWEAVYKDSLANGQDEASARQTANESRRWIQSINFNEAKALQRQAGYGRNCGIIGVGLSNINILTMLEDDNIPYIIPYHASGLPEVIRSLTNLNHADDYTNSQNTRIFVGLTTKSDGVTHGYEYVHELKEKLGSYHAAWNYIAEGIRAGSIIPEGRVAEKDEKNKDGEVYDLGSLGGFDYYGELEKGKNPHDAAEAYLAYCDEYGLLPVFPQFAGHQNYYKLLLDFSVTDLSDNGATSPQGPVRNIYPGLDLEQGQESYDELQGIISGEMEKQNEINRYRDQVVEGVTADFSQRLSISDTDSEGNKLTEGQREYFKDSKAVDANGHLLTQYHVTRSGGFTTFDPSLSFDEVSMSFSDDMDFALNYASEDGDIDDIITASETRFGDEELPPLDAFEERIGHYKVYLNIVNPLILEGDYLEERDMYEWAAFAKAQGYDGAIYRDFEGEGSDIYQVFSPDQIKDTRTENPTDDPDIRRSFSDDDIISQIAEESTNTDDIPSDDIIDEEDRIRRAKSKDDFLQSMNAIWNERWLTEGKILKTDSVVKDIRNLVMGVMQNSDTSHQYKTKLVKDTLVDAKKAFNYMKSGKWIECRDLLYDSALHMIEEAEFVDDSAFQEYKEVRDYLKKTEIRVGPEYQSDVHYGEFWKRNRSRMLLKKGETNIDNVYMELSEMLPGRFDQEAVSNPADQLYDIEAFLNETEPYKRAYDSQTASDMACDIAQDLFNIVYQGEEYKSVADTYKERYKEATKQMKAAHRDAIRKIREQENEKRRIQKEKFKAKEQETKQKAEHKLFYKSIQKNVKKLSDLIVKETDEKHVPEQFRVALSEMLTYFDLQTEGSKKWEEKHGTSKAAEKIRALRDEWAKIADENDTGSFEHDEEMFERIDDVVKALEGKGSIDSLKNEEMDTIDDMLKAVLHQLRVYNSVIKEGERVRIASVAEPFMESMVQRISKYGARSTRYGAIGALDRLINEGEETPVYFFDRLGGGMKDMYLELRNGNDKHIRNMNYLRTRFGQICGKYQKKIGKRSMPGSELEKWRKESSAITFNLAYDTVSLTPAQIMSVYCLSQREQARKHMLKNGIVASPVTFVAGIKDNVKRNVKGTKVKTKPVPLTEADIDTIKAELTPEQKQMADEFMKLLNEEMSDWGNETSMELLGYEKFREKNYFPIRSSSESLKKTPESHTVEEKIRNFSFTKGVNKNADNAIMVDDIFSVVADHCNKMSLYNAFAVPIRNFMKVYNYKLWDEDGKSKDLKRFIADAFGTRANDYIMQFMSDLNGNTKTKSDPLEAVMNKTLANYKRASIGANLRVALQQPTAIMRCFMEISPKYFKGVKPVSPANVREMQEHCPIALWKSWGHYDVDMGRDIEEVMMNNDWSIGDAVSMGLYGALDNMTWGAIWQAVKNEIRATHPEVHEGTDEFWELCNKRASEVFDKTQVVDSIFHRSDTMRSKNILTKMMVSFMAEPTLTYNVLRDALVNAREMKKDGDNAGANKRIARMAVVLALNTVAVSASAALWDIVRGKDPDLGIIEKLFGDDDDDDKDKEKSLGELYFRNFLNNLSDNGNLLNNIYFVKDVWGLRDGFGTSNMALEGFKLMWKGINEIEAKVGLKEWSDLREGEKTWYEINQNFLGGIGYITGKPVKTVMKDLKPAVDIFVDTVFAAEPGYQITLSDGSVITTTNYDEYAAAAEEHSGEIESSGYTEKAMGAFGTLVNYILKDNESAKRRKEAEKAKEEEEKGEDTKSEKKSSGTTGKKKKKKFADMTDNEKITYLKDKYAGDTREEKTKKVWDRINDGYRDYIDKGDYDHIFQMRRIMASTGCDMNFYEEKVLDASKKALKKSIISGATDEQIRQQEEIRDYLVYHGVSQEELSEIAMKSDTVKDLKAAMRLNDHDAMVEELKPLIRAGLTYEDFERIWENRNTGRKTYKGKYHEREKQISTGTFNYPAQGVITSGFGPRKAPVRGASTYHQGIDIGGSIGDPIAASDGGTVTFAGWNGGYGYQVVIKHYDGSESLYSHLDSYNVQPGDIVGQGDQIARMGSTGTSSGPHLDFRIRVNGKFVNPMSYLNNGAVA